MGYIPRGAPSQYPTYHFADPISPTDESTFDAWMMLPSDDLRTLDEYAANPVPREVSWSFVPPIPHVDPITLPPFPEWSGDFPQKPIFPTNRNVK